MYVTRPLSHFAKFPNSLSVPPEGPNSGYLVIQDEESETYSCFGLCKNHLLLDLPFPQNKSLTVSYTVGSDENRSTRRNDVVLIPVLNLPLSSNRYYAIEPHGRHKGEASTCSREEDMNTCCFCRFYNDVKPRPLDPKNIYQQFEIDNQQIMCNGKGSFYFKSVAPDGIPPYSLRQNGWSISTETPKNYKLDEVLGLNATLRARLPEFNFPASYKTSEAVVVGKWYSPFMFIKEGALKDQLERSRFYQITLEQRWEQIYTCLNNYTEGNSVHVDVSLDREVVCIAGRRAVWDEKNVVDGTIFFTSFGPVGQETSIGLSVEIIQRMKWEQERGSWSGGQERQEKVKRVEKFGKTDQWREFGCYVLVESFVLRRMDGSVAMTYDFWHTHQMRCKWA